MRALVYRILAALAVAILLGAIWLLWENRPQLATVCDGGSAMTDGANGFFGEINLGR